MNQQFKHCPGCNKDRLITFFHFRDATNTERNTLCKLCRAHGVKVSKQKKHKPTNEELDAFKEALRDVLGLRPLRGETYESTVERFSPSLVIYGDGNRKVRRQDGAI